MRYYFTPFNPTQFSQKTQNRKLVSLFHAWSEGFSVQKVASCSNEKIRNFLKH